jgi:hypothetical protein
MGSGSRRHLALCDVDLIMDEADHAEAKEQAMRQQAIDLVRKKASAIAPPSPACLYCGEPWRDGRRWCDADCRDLWEKDRQ